MGEVCEKDKAPAGKAPSARSSSSDTVNAVMSDHGPKYEMNVNESTLM